MAAKTRTGVPAKDAVAHPKLKALSVSLQNRPGAAAHISRALADAGVNINAVECEVLGQFGFFRFHTDTPERAELALRKEGYIITESPVVEVVLPNKIGELARALEILADGRVNCESVFGSGLKVGSEGRIFVRVSDAEKAHALLTKAGFQAYRLAH